MTITNVTAVQLSNTQVQLSWVTDAALPATWDIQRQIDDGGFAARADLRDQVALVYFDPIDITVLVPGTDLTYLVTDPLNVVDEGSNRITLIDVDAAYTYGAVSYLNTAPRYTTLVDVKKVLNITDTTLDDDLTTAIVAAELQIDVYNERSFPDTGANPQIPGIPSTISVWALDASVAVFKLRDTSAGGFEVGNDAWIGAVDVTDQVRRALRRNPLALGYKIKFGVA